jgi:PKHD-type hydroxylase
MNLQNYYWFFQSVLSKDFCDNLIKFGNQQREELALTGGQTEKIKEGKKLTEDDLKDLKKKRDSNIVWLNEQWIYDEILPYVNTANKNAGWNFEFSWSESCQFTKYKLDQYYDWHCDSWDKPYGENFDNLNLRGKVRKLSVTVSLSDPNDYEGGELEFDFRNLDPDKPANIKICEEIKPQGSIVVFPSHVWHRVKPVTKGTRYSLVIWSCGYPFK